MCSSILVPEVFNTFNWEIEKRKPLEPGYIFYHSQTTSPHSYHKKGKKILNHTLNNSLFIYFFPIGNPWTFQYFVQHFLSKSLIWPTVTGGCRCDRETLNWIEQGGFKMVNSEKISANLTTEIFSGCEADMFSLWTARIRMSIVNSILVGFAEKECYTEEKKLLWSSSFQMDWRGISNKKKRKP